MSEISDKACIAFKMHLKEGCKEEYTRRHERIWPELKDMLMAHGISDYSIFLDEETNTLFGYQRVSGSGGSQNLGQHTIVQKWWDYMSDIMETNEDKSPVTTTLERVFSL